MSDANPPLRPERAFHSLPPEIRAMALVGHYLQSFALMESNLNETLGAALKLDGLQTLIVTKNIMVGSKVRMLRAMLDLAFMPPEAKPEFDKMLTRITQLASRDRNMAAHDVFLASDEVTGVRFIYIDTDGKLKFPDRQWSVEDAETRVRELERISDKLKALRLHLETADMLKAIVRARGASKGSPEVGAIASLFGEAENEATDGSAA